ncbi:MAG: hypothetical protein ACMUIE_09295 [Thermoplasmatota archaeon]
MRIGDVGTVSPSGDLLAFSIAVVMVVSLSIHLLDRNGGEHQFADIDPKDIELVLAWRGLDPDENGAIEVSDGEIGLDPNKGPFPLPGKIGLAVRGREGGAESYFIDGDATSPGSVLKIGSPIRSVAILVEEKGRISPGTLSIFIWEGAE